MMRRRSRSTLRPSAGAGVRMVSGQGAAAMGGREVVGGGDPLAGIPFRMRFETHWGDKVLRPDFFQDVARTIPVMQEGDLVATMGPADAEFVPEQSDDSKQGMLLLAADGTPYKDYDGVNDSDVIGTLGGQIAYTCLIKSTSASWNAFWSLLDQTLGSPGDRFGLFSSGGTQWHNDPFPASVRKDGVPLASPFNMAPIDDWMVVSVVTNTSPNDIHRALFQLESNFFGQAGAIAFFLHDGIPSSEYRNEVEAFYETLKPAP